MKAFLPVVAVVVLLSIVQAKVGPTFGVERLLFRKESLTDNLESMDEDEKETGSVSQPCCFPKSFQSTLNYYEPGLSAPDEEEIFVDAATSRVAITWDKKRRVWSCTDCSCTVTTIVEHLRHCEQEILPNTDFDDVYDECVPQNAKNLGTVRMGNDGSKKSSMLVQQWAFSTGSENVSLLVTAKGCFPVAYIETRTSGSCQSQLMTKYYFDVESPVKDQRVFDIPLYCRTANKEEAVRDEDPDLTSVLQVKRKLAPHARVMNNNYN